MTAGYTDFLGFKSGRFNSDLCSVSIVNYNSAVSEEWHCHENFHLSAILKGGNLESRQRADIQVLPGKFLAYQSGEIHRNRFTEFPSKNLNVELKDAFVKENNIPISSLSTNSGYIDVDISFTLMKIYHELKLQDQYSVDTIHILLKSIFSKHENLKSKPFWLKKLKEIVEDRWQEFIPLEDLANEINVHPVTISKYFRKHYHCTLGDYMRKIKVEKAIYLILNTNKLSGEIAYTCGFSDQSHMTRLFRFYTGLKPKEISRL